MSPEWKMQQRELEERYRTGQRRVLWQSTYIREDDEGKLRRVSNTMNLGFNKQKRGKK